MAEGVVKFLLGLDIHSVGFCGVTRASDVSFFATNIQVGNPKGLSLVLRNSLKAGLIFTRQAVLSVFSRGNDTKVFPPVVITDSIPVVNFAVRHMAGHVKKRQSMRSISLAIHAEVDVPMCGRSNNLSNSSAKMVCGGKACEFARFRVIVENLFKTILIHWLNVMDLHTMRKVV